MRSKSTLPLSASPELLWPVLQPLCATNAPHSAATQFLAWLRTDRSARPSGLRIWLVAAHPDDEMIGAGAQLPWFDRLTLLHLTDGAPRNLFDATRAGFSDCQGYAAARRAELQEALSLLGKGEIDPRPQSVQHR